MSSQKVFKNSNTGDVFVTTDAYDIARLSGLDNWDLLEGRHRERALADGGHQDLSINGDANPKVPDIGELSEDNNTNGAGTEHNPDALNEDKAAHAKDEKNGEQQAVALEDLTVAELKAHAKDNEIDLGGAKSKAEILDLIRGV